MVKHMVQSKGEEYEYSEQCSVLLNPVAVYMCKTDLSQIANTLLSNLLLLLRECFFFKAKQNSLL